MPTTPRYIKPAVIERLAQRISEDAKLNEQEPGAVDVIKLANYFDCDVETVDFNPSTISAKIERKNGKCIIQVAKIDSGNRQRFSIAHEVSHLVLHDEGEFIEYRKPFAEYDNPNMLYKEVQANMLASALLMPKELVIKAWKATKDIDDIAEIFNVSRSSVYFRLENLGLLGLLGGE
jgi:Zn-dependent peptidase ImmA (M78 family)